MGTAIYGTLDELPEAAGALFEASGKQSLFLSRPWFENFLANVRTATQPMLWLFSSTHGELTGAMLPLWVPNGPSSRCLHGLANYYSPLFAPITSQSLPTADLLCDLLSPITQSGCRWNCVKLTPISGELAPVICEGFRRNGWVPNADVHCRNWYLPIEETGFKDYFAARPAQLRNTIVRKSRVWVRNGGRVTICTDASTVESAIAAYEHVYARSWKRAEPFADFVPGLARFAAERRWLRLGIASIGNTPVAAQLWLVKDGVASIFKLAYDESYRHMSPGTVLMAHIMEFVMECDRINEVDFLTGDDHFKRLWMSRVRVRYCIEAHDPKTPTGLMRVARRRAVTGARRLLRTRQ